MDERTIQPPGEVPAPARTVAVGAEAGGIEDGSGPVVGAPWPPHPAGLADPRALTILTTEHWSLLSARALVYNEAFVRAGMFLTFLSATLVALGLVSAGVGFRKEFLLVAAGVLALDLFIGIATIGRVASTTSEDLRYLQGMNRLRHAYHELVPGLEPYFIAGKHDDMPGVFGIYTTSQPMTLAGIFHGLTTTVGMLFVICAAVAAVLAAVVVLLVADAPIAAGIVALAVLVAGAAAGQATMSRRIAYLSESIEVRFPTPRG